MKQKNYDEIAQVFKALSNPKRLELFMMIYEGAKESGCCQPGEACGTVSGAFSRAVESMDLSKSTISHHIKELNQAGLINMHRSGQSKCCTINEELFKKVQEFFA